MTTTEAWGHYRPSQLAAVGIAAIKYRIARGALKRAIRGALHRHRPCYDIEVDGIRVRCHVRDNYTEASLLERGLSKHQDIVRVLVDRLRPGNACVDIGANCGLFSIFAAQAVGPTGRVLAIESIPTMLARLQFNVRSNNFDNVEIFATAIGAENGSVVLNVLDDRFGESSVTPLQGATLLTVPMTTLLGLVQTSGLKHIDALKIDIEGYEDRALLPFFAAAPRNLWPRLLMIEIAQSSRWEQDCLAPLIERGYRKAWSNRSDVLLELSAASH